MERLESKNIPVTSHPSTSLGAGRSQVRSCIVRLATCDLRLATDICFLLLFAFCIFNLTGCANLKEVIKGYSGTSTKVLEDGRKQAIARSFSCDYPVCYKQTLDILEQIGTYIYAKDATKQMVAIYLSEKDTTPVGLFFKEINRGSTQIEVSSPSDYAKELIAEKVFSGLEKALIVDEELSKVQK